jgi:hypothetical protein
MANDKIKRKEALPVRGVNWVMKNNLKNSAVPYKK